MKGKLLSASIVIGMTAQPCWAQSSVTISGIVDTAVAYVSNVAGTHNAQFFSIGEAYPNVLLFSGHEDLDSGTEAIFKLTNQFAIGTGSLVPEQSLFASSYVGIDNAHFGRLTIGSQFDLTFDSLVVTSDNAALYALVAVPNGPFNKLALPNNPTGALAWDRSTGESLPNAVKYLSPEFGGFSAGAMYSFGNVAGSIGANNGSSFALNYANGGFGVNAAYTNYKTDTPDGSVSVRLWGVGARYRAGPVTMNALFETVHNSANGGNVWQAQLGARWDVSSFWTLTGIYSYTKGNVVVDNNHSNQLTALARHYLSKRTSVHVLAAYQWTNSGAQAQIGGIMVPSSTSSQFVGGIGLTHFF